MQTLTPEEFKKKYGGGALDGFTNPVLSQPVQKPGLFSRVSDVIKTSGENVQQAISGEEEFAGRSPIRRGVEATAEAFSTVPKVALAAMPEPIRKASESIGEQVGKGFTAITNKIGDSEALQKWVMENPEAASKLEEVAGTLAAGGQIAGTILSAKGAADTLQTGVNAAGKGATKIQESFIAGKDNILSNVNKPEVASHVMDKVSRLKPTEYQKFQELSGGDSIGEYLTKTGNTQAPDKIIMREAQKFAQSKADVDSTLAQIDGKFKNEAIKETIKGVQERARSISSGKIKPSYWDEMQGYIKAYNDGGLDMSQINALKRLYEREVRLSYKKDITAGANLAKATEVDSALRNWQFSTAKKAGFENLAEMNKQTQLSKFVVDKLGKQMVGKSGLNDINLTDWVILSGGDPTAVGGFLTKKFFSSKGVQAKVAEMLNDKDVTPYISPDYKTTPTTQTTQ